MSRILNALQCIMLSALTHAGALFVGSNALGVGEGHSIAYSLTTRGFPNPPFSLCSALWIEATGTRTPIWDTLLSGGDLVNIHQRRRRALAIVGPEAYGGLGFLLGVGFVAQLLDSAESSVLAPPSAYSALVPPLVHLALLMRHEVRFALEELCAFGAVVLPQAGQVFYGLRILELGQMLCVVQVGVDLVEVARVAARLLLGGFSSDGGHGGRWEQDAGCWVLGCRTQGCIRGRSSKTWREPDQDGPCPVSRSENLELQNGSCAASRGRCYLAPLHGRSAGLRRFCNRRGRARKCAYRLRSRRGGGGS
jgi:hypothetical protein